MHCERHKSTDSELLFALGLFYTVTIRCMEHLMEGTIGLPPFLVRRTIQQLVLLWYTNISAHMKIPYVASGKGTLFWDPILLYEFLSGFVIDTLLEGGKVKIAEKLTPPPGIPSSLPLSAIFSNLASILNRDLERVGTKPPGFFKKKLIHILPPVFRSTQDAIHNQILSIFWPAIRDFIYETLLPVQEKGQLIGELTLSNIPLVAPLVKKTLSQILLDKYGISKKTSKFIFKLCKEEEFHRFLLALKHWLERHNTQNKKTLLTDSSSELNLYEESNQSTFEKPPKNSTTPLSIPSRATTKINLVKLDPSELNMKNSRKNGLDLNFLNTNSRKRAQKFPEGIDLQKSVHDNYF